MGSAYMRGAKENQVAVSIKHFPGDGVDERDQHIVTSVNSMSTDEWDKTYGYVYQSLIDEGAQTVMAGHIAQPAYVEKTLSVAATAIGFPNEVPSKQIPSPPLSVFAAISRGIFAIFCIVS